MSDNLNLKNKLSKLAYEVTQNSSTEKAFSGKFYNFFEDGVYACVCCKKNYSALIINLFLNQVGQVFSKH